MGRILIGIAGLVIGLIGGAVFGGALIGGAAAGIGIATGASAGICMTIKAAGEEGLLTPDEIDQILTRAAADAAALGGNEAPREIVGSADDCAAVLQRIRESAE
ncbi:hypothetical protein ACFORG_06055 [Lutimaribacter marinistellae]|uniref:Uncharacterized protein n=1 Tax=Lutimaribacter marinistellae TaxID=1820329 RepID=A0ABV7TFU8_9RHOB